MQEEGLDLYVNQVGVFFSAYDVVLDFGMTDPKGERKPIVRVRMSPQHALVMTKLLAKNLDLYQKNIGKLELPDKLYQEINISKD